MSATDSGVRKSLHDLYSDHHGWLGGWLRKKAGCSEKAADLLHDTFVRLLVRYESLQAREPRAYLKTVAKRVLIDHWRRERIEQAYREALMQLPEEYALDPAERHILLETLEDIDRRLEGLPAIVRRAFLLSQLRGMKQAEIAKELEISISTVKRYLVQAGTQCYFALQVDV